MNRLTSWLSFVMSNCEVVNFLIGIMGQVWFLIVSIPDLGTLYYFVGCRLVAFIWLLSWCTVSV